MPSNWHHSGFNVFCGPRIQPGDAEAMENLARYIIRASFSQERMTYIPDESKVVYRAKDNKKEKTFDALEWLPCVHISQIGENKWFDITAITVISVGARGKNKTMMMPFPAFWNLKAHQRDTVKVGLG